MNRPSASTDDQLRGALRELPIVAPSATFSRQVLAKVDAAARAPLDRPRTIRRRLLPLPAWAGATVAVALLLGAWWATTLNRAAAAEARKRALRQESAAIARELAALRDEAAATAPVLYLGGNEEVDVVLDLSTLPLAASRLPPAQ